MQVRAEKRDEAFVVLEPFRRLVELLESSLLAVFGSVATSGCSAGAQTWVELIP